MLIIQRPTVEARRGRGQPPDASPSARSSPASATRSATACAARCCRRSPVPPSRRCASTTRCTSSTPSPGSRRTSPTSSSTSRTSCCVCHSDEPVTLRLDVRGPATSPPATSRRRPTSRSSTPTSTSPRSTSRPASPSTSPCRQGRGYLSADRNKGSATIGVIPVDAIFSPVRRVAFPIEPTRVEQSTDLRPPRARHRDRRLDLARARRSPRPATRCARSSASSPS